MTIAQPITLLSGASSGIGGALAQLFAEKGREFALVALRSPLEALEQRYVPIPSVLNALLRQPRRNVESKVSMAYNALSDDSKKAIWVITIFAEELDQTPGR
jgi:NADP-dependent 3-hydroxy acid dehydrogenase YdfG